MNEKRFVMIAAVVVALLSTGVVVAGEWPQYRGPERDGRSSETGLALTWSEDGPRERWRAPLGQGYSGIVVAGGRVYTLFGSKEGEFAVAFDAASGKELWRFRLDENRFDRFGSGPRSTPTVDGETVYVLGAHSKLYALDAVEGEKRWGVDLAETYGAKVPTWGVSTSPLVEGDLLLVDAGGKEGHSLLALDKKSGALRWSSQTDKPGYASPLAIEVDGVRQVVFFTGTALVSVSPASGKLYWRLPWQTNYDVNAAMPVFIPPNKIFASSSYDKGAVVVEVKKNGDGAAIEEVWRDRVMKNHFNSSVLVDNVLYGFDDGTLKAIDPATGEQKWAKRGFSKGSLMYADGHLVVLGERGTLAVIEATAEEYREKARSQVFEAKTWTMPTLADGTLYVRSEKELVALDVSGEKS